MRPHLDPGTRATSRCSGCPRLRGIPGAVAGRRGTALVAFSALDDFARRWLFTQILKLGFTADGELSLEGWNERLGVAPRYRALLVALLAVLETDGVVVARNGRYRIAPSAVAQSAAELQAEYAHLKNQHPVLVPYLALLEACLSRYSDLLTGRVDHMEVLFPQGSLRLVEGIYSGNVATDYYNQQLAELTRSAVEQLVTQGKEKVRLLEVGAGTGGASRLVLAALRDLGERIEYVYTDVSTGFLRHAEQRFGREYPFVTTRLFDVEKDPRSQGFTAGEFDIVLAYNVIHATSRLSVSLGHCKRLLKTHGLLLLNELSRHPDFTTLTFGLTPGWWRFEDVADRLPHGPAASPSQWVRVLEEVGFHGVGVYPRETPEGATSLQSILVAESDGWIDGAAAEPQTTPESTTPAPAPPEKKATVKAGDWQLRVEDHLVPIFSQVLKLEPGTMRPGEPFDQYGLESLSVLEITSRLEGQLGELPKTLLFEQNSISKVSRYLLENHRPGVERALAAVPSKPAGRPVETEERKQTEAVEAPALSPTKLEVESFAVAIVGLSGRYPEAETLDEFWENLKAGRNCVREVPPSAGTTTAISMPPAGTSSRATRASVAS